MNKKSKKRLFSYIKRIKIEEENQKLHMAFQAAFVYLSAMQDENCISSNNFSRLMKVIMSVYSKKIDEKMTQFNLENSI
ncbi:MAG: hypothetical protein K2X69_17360 [Silvanigrellaceae bacterium]|nr:hypothetical protein [Silvanigrellaceae bacterium]